LPGDLLEHRQLSVIMGRANVLDAARPLPGGVHDLHRTGPRRRPDRANVRTHTPTLVRTPTHATPHNPNNNQPPTTQPPHNEPSQVSPSPLSQQLLGKAVLTRTPIWSTLDSAAASRCGEEVSAGAPVLSRGPGVRVTHYLGDIFSTLTRRSMSSQPALIPACASPKAPSTWSGTQSFLSLPPNLWVSLKSRATIPLFTAIAADR